LVASGVLTAEEITQIRDAPTIWTSSPSGQALKAGTTSPTRLTPVIGAAVAAGLLPADVADLLSEDEVSAAMSHGWGENGPDQTAAIDAALSRARGNAVSSDTVLTSIRTAGPAA
jgi:hypothetical protein